MVPQASRRTSLTIDPVALLKREHGLILDQLAMIEAAMGSRAVGRGTAKETDRTTLRELFQFFTGPVEVHFKREEVLVGDLQRVLGRKQEGQKQFQSFLDEHRTLKADAAAVMRKLGRKRTAGQDAAVKTLAGLRTPNARSCVTLIERSGRSRSRNLATTSISQPCDSSSKPTSSRC